MRRLMVMPLLLLEVVEVIKLVATVAGSKPLKRNVSSIYSNSNAYAYAYTYAYSGEAM
jgi:hypothetical protein